MSSNRRKNYMADIKHTFEYNGNEKTVTITDEVQRQGRADGLSLVETIERYLSDEGYIVNDTVTALTEKAKANGVNTAGRNQAAIKKKRKAPERKPDETKRMLIAALNNTLSTLGYCEDVEVTNIERMIKFRVNDDKFELTLGKKRKPKK